MLVGVVAAASEQANAADSASRQAIGERIGEFRGSGPASSAESGRGGGSVQRASEWGRERGLRGRIADAAQCVQHDGDAGAEGDGRGTEEQRCVPAGVRREGVFEESGEERGE